jgi:hypothetical protein
VSKGAKGARSNVVCDALLLDERSRSDTYPSVGWDEDKNLEGAGSLGRDKPTSWLFETLRHREQTRATGLPRSVRGWPNAGAPRA